MYFVIARHFLAYMLNKNKRRVYVDLAILYLIKNELKTYYLFSIFHFHWYTDKY